MTFRLCRRNQEAAASWFFLRILSFPVFSPGNDQASSLITSAARQLVCILPAAWLFASVFGLHAVWYAFPLAEIISVVLTTLLFRRIDRKKIQLL